MKIVRFTPDRTEEVIALTHTAWTPVFARMQGAVPKFVIDNFYPEGWPVRQEADVRALLMDPATPVWLSLEGEAVTGFVGLRLHPEDRMGEIHILAVHPDHQRRGVGRALLAHGLSELKASGCAMAMVETGGDPGHAPSRATYEAAGFERWPVARYFRPL